MRGISTSCFFLDFNLALRKCCKLHVQAEHYRPLRSTRSYSCKKHFLYDAPSPLLLSVSLSTFPERVTFLGHGLRYMV